MKNLLPLTLLVSVLGASAFTAPAFADSYDQAVNAEVNQHRAARQEFKANRDAAFGNYAGAERHAFNAARDEHRAHRDMHRAYRDARWGD